MFLFFWFTIRDRGVPARRQLLLFKKQSLNLLAQQIITESFEPICLEPKGLRKKKSFPQRRLSKGVHSKTFSLAVHVPMNPEEMVPDGAFAAVPRLRHVSVEAGIRVGAEAWQCC